MGIPENYFLPCGPKTLSHYHCQVPPCTLDFAQKATASNHVWNDHLNAALASLYCSFKILKCIGTALLLGNITLGNISQTTCLFSWIIPLSLRNSYHSLVVMLSLVHLSKFCLMKKRLESGHKLPNISLRKNKPPDKFPLQPLYLLKWKN